MPCSILPASQAPVCLREKRRGGRGRGSGCCVGVRDIELINKVSRVDKEVRQRIKREGVLVAAEPCR